MKSWSKRRREENDEMRRETYRAVTVVEWVTINATARVSTTATATWETTTGRGYHGVNLARERITNGYETRG